MWHELDKEWQLAMQFEQGLESVVDTATLLDDTASSLGEPIDWDFESMDPKGRLLAPNQSRSLKSAPQSSKYHIWNHRYHNSFSGLIEFLIHRVNARLSLLKMRFRPWINRHY